MQQGEDFVYKYKLLPCCLTRFIKKSSSLNLLQPRFLISSWKSRKIFFRIFIFLRKKKSIPRLLGAFLVNLCNRKLFSVSLFFLHKKSLILAKYHFIVRYLFLSTKRNKTKSIFFAPNFS